MESLRPYEINCRSLSDRYKIWGIGDTHLYSACCIEERIRRLIREIEADPLSYWIGLGDYADCIDQYDKRYDSSEIDPSKRDAFFGYLSDHIVDDITKLFYPIRHKCIGMCLGNHEWSYENRKNIPTISRVCDRLSTARNRVRYLHYSAIFDVAFCKGKKRVLRKFYVHHGAGAATTTGGKVNRVTKFADIADCDVAMVGHGHEIVGIPIVRLAQDENYDLVEREMMAIMSGSYLATYRQGQTSYGERKGYKPVPLGSAAVTFVPDTGWMGMERR
jgi:predicted phosphodiesterase